MRLVTTIGRAAGAAYVLVRDRRPPRPVQHGVHDPRALRSSDFDAQGRRELQEGQK
ncbi:hypothetical protein NGB36_02180 [Streptomyces sp. RB6PN25]|uniref:Uncharacterized protein n=1 Tax=Streptomyces humicola TaxID=2953240 RepID=A0ABT1PP48_9ACTN|nr:hypothetical protein [Streptomyces humicola]MCQ4079438.1 hypothetical protein [Streptomyces humicola]